VHPPWGLFGGRPGRRGTIEVVHDDGRRQRLAIKPASLEVPPTAVVWIETPGAGGYGAPRLRDREKLEEDRRGGKFSARFLRTHYGYEARGVRRSRTRKTGPRKRTRPGRALRAAGRPE
jgi:N-methylhydantoinase B